MADLSDFQRGHIVGARMVGASVTETARMLGVSRGTVSKVMTAFEREGKTSSAKHRSDRKSKLSERDRRTLNRIVREDRKTTAPKLTAELNEHLQNPVSTKTVR
ncbi:Homeobox domain-like, partial [Trinorchestia longiramus]